MRLLKSVCTNLVFPASRTDLDEFRRMAEFLAGRGVDGIEFYHDGPGRDRTGRIAADAGLSPVYIAVIPSKEQKLYLCDTDGDQRRKAVAMLKNCLDEAAANGIDTLMINSGRIEADTDLGLEALADSLEQLCNHADAHNYKIDICLEPCDSHMDAMHLIGPYARAVSFVEKMRKRGVPLSLTMDSAHTSEEGEDFLEAVKGARPHCNHIHFANCRISDPADSLYGDKHLGFEYADTPWTPKTLAILFTQLEALYPGEDHLRIALEVLCREDDPYAYFDTMWKSLPFLSEA